MPSLHPLATLPRVQAHHPAAERPDRIQLGECSGATDGISPKFEKFSSALLNVTQSKCYTPGGYGGILCELGFEVPPYQATHGDRGFFAAVLS